MTRYYAEFEWVDKTILRSLPNDGHVEFTEESDSCALSEAVNRNVTINRKYHNPIEMLVVYTENSDGTMRTIWEKGMPI